MPTHSLFYRRLTLVGYLGLLIFVILLHTWLAPSDFLPLPVSLVMWVVPLLLPLKGILQGKPYTHAWANFVLMLYFLHSLTTLYIYPGQRWMAVVELLLVTTAFVGATFYARYAGREQGLGLKKKKATSDS